MVIWACEANIELIQIFLADGRTNEGVPRGPRRPKKHIVVSWNKQCTSDQLRHMWVSRIHNAVSLKHKKTIVQSICIFLRLQQYFLI